MIHKYKIRIMINPIHYTQDLIWRRVFHQQLDTLMNVGWLNLQCIMGSQVIKLLEYCNFLCSDTTF